MRKFSSIILTRSRPWKLARSNTKDVPLRQPPIRSHPKGFLFPLATLEKSYQNHMLLNYPKHYTKFSISNQQYVHFSSSREQPGNRTQLEVEIISTENIKPSTPTPEHLRTYEISILDQLFPNIYVPFVFFYPNNHQNDKKWINTEELVHTRKQNLKKALSKTLTIFYPLAGKIKDNRHIDCKDEGVHYVEANVRDSLPDFLKCPENKSIQKLQPFDHNSKETFSRKSVIEVQVTVFSCGGIAIGLCTSHKIIDGYSRGIFLKAWAAAARESSEEICPNFVSPFIFPSNPSLPENATWGMLPMFRTQKRATRRFVFGASSLGTLKRNSNASSRAIAVTGLIWKCAIAASKAQSVTSNWAPQSYVLSITVNLRERSLPPMPPHSIGNVWFFAPTQCNAGHEHDLRLDHIVQSLKNNIDKLDANFVEKLKGEAGLFRVEGAFDEMLKFYSDENTEYIKVSSMCNFELYDVDFGCGKPTWIWFGGFPFLNNVVMLMDTRYTQGIEAWVTLSEEDMNVFENDPEIISRSSLNPSPLEIIE